MAATYRTNVFRDRIDSLICATDHHFVEDDLLGAENNSILALNTRNRAEKKRVNQ